MKNLLFLSLLFSSQVTFADTAVSFIINSWLPFGGNVYYNCDTVESVTYEMLEKIGAKKISVHCTGGISSMGGYATDALVSANFVVPTTGTLQVVQFQGWSQCHLVTEIFHGIKTQFSIQSVEGIRTCIRADDDYRFTVSLIK